MEVCPRGNLLKHWSTSDKCAPCFGRLVVLIETLIPLHFPVYNPALHHSVGHGKASVRTAKILSEFEQELLSFKVVSSNGFLNILTSKGTYKRRRIRVIYYSKTSIRRPSVGEPASVHLMEIGR